MATVGEIMTTGLVTCRPGDTVVDAVARMAEAEIGAVLLVEKGGKLVGLFSERDLLLRVIAEGRSPAVVKVGEVATHDLVTVEASTSARQCAELLRQHRFRHLPVVRDGAPVGILSARDFFDYVASGFERFIDRARYEESLEEGIDPYDHLGGGYEG